MVLAQEISFAAVVSVYILAFPGFFFGELVQCFLGAKWTLGITASCGRELQNSMSCYMKNHLLLLTMNLWSHNFNSSLVRKGNKSKHSAPDYFPCTTNDFVAHALSLSSIASHPNEEVLACFIIPYVWYLQLLLMLSFNLSSSYWLFLVFL